MRVNLVTVGLVRVNLVMVGLVRATLVMVGLVRATLVMVGLVRVNLVMHMVFERTKSFANVVFTNFIVCCSNSQNWTNKHFYLSHSPQAKF